MEREDWGRVRPGPPTLLPLLALAGLVMGLGACAKKHHRSHECHCGHGGEHAHQCRCAGGHGRECHCGDVKWGQHEEGGHRGHEHGSCAQGKCRHGMGRGECKCEHGHEHGREHEYGHEHGHDHGPGFGPGEGPDEPRERRGPAGARRFRLNPLRILDRRYALGQMDEEDYLRRRQILLEHATGEPEGPRP